MPGLKTTKTYSSGDYSWMYNSRGITFGMTATLDISKFTKDTHYPDGYIRNGTPVNIAAPGAGIPWADAAGAVIGFVGGDYETDGVEKINVHVITHPEIVKLDRLPVPLTKPTTAPQPHIHFVSIGG